MLPSLQNSMRSASSTKRKALSPRALISRRNSWEYPAMLFTYLEKSARQPKLPNMREVRGWRFTESIAGEVARADAPKLMPDYETSVGAMLAMLWVTTENEIGGPSGLSTSARRA